MLSNITITCFAACYLIALVLEVSRLFFRAPIRLPIIVGITLAGLFAHASHIVVEANDGLSQSAVPLSRWYDWCLLAGFFLAVVYMVAVIRRPKTVLGLFLLPAVLVTIALAFLFFGAAPFEKREDESTLGMVHGIALLIGAAIVMLGFVAGLMYLSQSYRLKHKLPPRQGFKLPSLEFLQRVNRQSLLYSSFFIAIGLVAGVALNLARDKMLWRDPLVITSSAWLVWLVVASLFEYFYKPARQGRKVAYLTIASFVFLGLVLGTMLLGLSDSHGPKDKLSKRASATKAVPVVSFQNEGDER